MSIVIVHYTAAELIKCTELQRTQNVKTQSDEYFVCVCVPQQNVNASRTARQRCIYQCMERCVVCLTICRPERRRRLPSFTGKPLAKFWPFTFCLIDCNHTFNARAMHESSLCISIHADSGLLHPTAPSLKMFCALTGNGISKIDAETHFLLADNLSH